MEALQVVILAVGALGGFAGLRTAYLARHDRRMGVREADRADLDSEANRHNALIDRLMQRIGALEARVEHLEAERRRDHHRIAQLDDHIDVLEAHIWRGDGAPPPPRPMPAT